MSTARQKIIQARTNLVLDQPFWGALALRLKVVETERVPMAATDGTYMFYNPQYVDRIPFDEVLGLFAEETMHNAHGHSWRRDGREPRSWNVACDLALCNELKAAGFNTGDMLHDPKTVGKSAEWIHARLPKQGPDGLRGQGRGRKGKPGGDTNQQGGSSHDGTEGGGRVQVLDPPTDGTTVDGVEPMTEADWRQAVQQAAAAAKGRGHLPASLARLAQQAAQPKVDWRSVLHRFVQQAAREDYSWRTPNPRYLPGGLYLPALRSETVGPIAVAVDTSGSIDAVLLAQFAAELRSVVDDVRPARVHVIWCDAKVHRVDTFERDDVIELKPVGGGGTSHVPVMNLVDAMEEPPVALICLTDLATAHRPEPPLMPVLWAATNPGAAPVPYGEVVAVE